MAVMTEEDTFVKLRRVGYKDSVAELRAFVDSIGDKISNYEFRRLLKSKSETLGWHFGDFFIETQSSVLWNKKALIAMDFGIFKT